MKNKTLILLILQVLLMSGAVFFSQSTLTDKNVLSLVMLVLAFVSLGLLIGTWLWYISKMAETTSSSLGKIEEASTLSFRNLDILEKNHLLIKKKFDLSVDYISKLGDLNNAEPVDEFLHQDKIGQALIRIREEMTKLKDEENKRIWVTEGLAKFSEIIRNKAEVNEYGQNIISNLVKYLNASQGALFMLYEGGPNESRYMQMLAGYACDKEVHKDTKIHEGQGLLGQCMLNNEIMLISNVPKDYVKIHSGLGMGTPNFIVIAPLIINEKFFGAIELAFLEVVPSYRIEFLKEVCESIASEIASIKSFQQTQHLLDESKAMTSELQRSEAEMQRNMEELAIAQKEMLHKQNELAEVMSAIDSTLATAEFDLSGNFVAANEIFYTVMGYHSPELNGVAYHRLMKDDSNVHLMWENLRMGKFFSGDFKMHDKTGKELWLTGTFNPISISEGVPEKVMMFAQFTSQEKEKIHDLGIMVNALKATLPVVEFTDQLACKSANEKFLKMFDVSRVQLKNKHLHDFIDHQYAPVFNNVQKEILNRDFSTLLLPVIINGHVVSYEASLTVARNLEGAITRIILILVKEVKEQVAALGG